MNKMILAYLVVFLGALHCATGASKKIGRYVNRAEPQEAVFQERPRRLERRIHLEERMNRARVELVQLQAEREQLERKRREMDSKRQELEKIYSDECHQRRLECALCISLFVVCVGLMDKDKRPFSQWW